MPLAAKFKKCSNEISKKMKNCPNPGTPNKTISSTLIMFSTGVLFLVLFVIVGCSTEENKQDINASKTVNAKPQKVTRQVKQPVTMKDQAQINAKASSTQDNRILVNGETNLPNATGFMISVVNKMTGFSAQGQSSVMNGKFTAGPFGPMKGLSAGNYSIEIVMPISRVQPASVQNIIGIDGEYLSGPLVDNSVVGKTIEYSFSYTMGTQKSIAKTESDHKKLLYEVKKSVNKSLKAGRSMEKLRHTDNLSMVRTCVEKMRQYQQEANLVSKKAKSLTSKYILLKASTHELNSCVSCKNSALESCGRAEDLLLGKL